MLLKVNKFLPEARKVTAKIAVYTAILLWSIACISEYQYVKGYFIICFCIMLSLVLI